MIGSRADLQKKADGLRRRMAAFSAALCALRKAQACQEFEDAGCFQSFLWEVFCDDEL